ncbi:MAG: hypothetical protein D6740_00855 [Alphaproteobacteria bacterium]|nr:MAG: hypothetical protein D6740_00855 [Alphaproteobacteria bacterium]
MRKEMTFWRFYIAPGDDLLWRYAQGRASVMEMRSVAFAVRRYRHVRVMVSQVREQLPTYLAAEAASLEEEVPARLRDLVDLARRRLAGEPSENGSGARH